MHIPRRHLNYANVVATLALVFAMSGGALAAKHYLINSTKQINPKVLKKLKGNAGKTGATGAAGVAGAPGATGSQGKEGAKGADGTAVAYAHVSATGVLDTANSKNVSEASLAGTGIFCLTVTVPIKNASGAVDTGNSGGQFGFVSAILSGQDPSKYVASLCPGHNVLVGTAEHKGENQSMAFWVSFN